MRILLACALGALAGASMSAQDFELEFSEQLLNRIVSRLGAPSSQGIHHSNALSGLGYSNCISLAALDCPDVTARPTFQAGAGRQAIGLSLCRGPDGLSAVVPSADPVSWQWWITQARFSIGTGQLQFVATVRYRVGTQWFSDERTVPATLSLDAASQRLKMEVGSFKVPIRYSTNGVGETVTEVDVARYMTFAIPIGAQSFEVKDLDGRARTVTSRAQSASVEYQAGLIRVKVNGAFY